MYDEPGLPKAASTKPFEATFQIIKKTIEGGEDVPVTGLGKFCVKDKRKCRGRNPDTGEDLMLAERLVVSFKCSTVLKRRLNGEAEVILRPG